MRMTRPLAGLAGITLLGFVACGGGSSPSGPGLSVDRAEVSESVGGFRASDTAPPVSAEEACPAGLETETVGSVTACVHSNDFVGNCITKDMLVGKPELVLEMGFLNPDGPLLYNKPALYHTNKATCFPELEFFGSASDNVTGFPIASGNNGIATWTLPLPKDACGTYTFLDTVRDGEGVLFMPLHQSVNTGTDCAMSCRDLKPHLEAAQIGIHAKVPIKIQRGYTFEFTATWKGKGTTAVLYKTTNRKEFAAAKVSPFVQRFTYSPTQFVAGETAILEVTTGSLTCSTKLQIGGGGQKTFR